MKFSIKDFYSKWDQTRKKLRIWHHLLKNLFMKNFLYGDNDSATLFEIPDINGMNTFVSKDRHLPIAVVGNCGILGYDNK